MKKVLLRIVLPIVLVFGVIALLCFSCSETRLRQNAEVTLTYVYGSKNIVVTLPGDEAQRVIGILDGNSYDPLSAGMPSCGFTSDVSLKVGGRLFAIACDTCNCLFDYGNLHFFDIPEEDMAYIHALFEKYGGKFPCV